MPFRYPPARADSLSETLHGVAVPDPFRWLEDPHSAETRAWVEAQNVLTRSVLDGPARDAFASELRPHFDRARTLSAYLRGDRCFFTHNPGLLNQPLIFVADRDGENARLLLDPNGLSTDGTTAVTAIFPSSDGSLMAYALSIHGSDRQVIRIRRIAEGTDLDDRIEWVKFASIAWTSDHASFYYLRFPEPGSVPPEDEQYFGRIYLHRLGQPQSMDTVVFEKPDQKEVVPLVHVTIDDRYAVITAQRGASDDSEVYLVDRRGSGQVRPLFSGFDAAYDFIDSSGGRLYFRTTRDAPRGRIVSIDPDDPAVRLRDVVGESAHRLSLAVMMRDGLACVYLENASDRVRRFDLGGAPLGEIPLPGLGSIVTIDAQADAEDVAFVFTSFVDPPSGRVFRNGRIFRLKAEATRAIFSPAETCSFRL